MKKKKILLRNKWVKWKFLNSKENLKTYQPLTSLYSKHKINEFLDLYKIAFVKPNNSLGGNKVIKIMKNDSSIIANYESVEYSFSNIDEFDNWLNPIKNNSLFLIQQGIELAKCDDSPVDMRTIAQLNENYQWEVTAMFAKVAKKGSVVTNVHAGGKMVPVEDYLSKLGFNKSKINDIISNMSDITLEICKEFYSEYRNVIYGLDIGFDINDKIWLIEINTRPRLDILKRIDKKMYQRAHSIAILNHKRMKSKE
jgi:glutathione synthase/RimK-type ligase-like ATP-grasp enzyme